MLRIISGEYGGRQFDSPPGNRAHPMSDRIRSALFNALGDLAGLSVLDAFGGSGALSFEAVSQGAGRVTTCESEPRVAKTIATNVEKLNLKGKVKLIDRSVYSWLRQDDDKYDLIFADPPYDEFAEHRLESLITALKPSGILVVSYPAQLDTPEFTGTKTLRQKTYGNAALAFYRKTD